MIPIIITLLLVLLNGFFVAAEFSIVKVRLSQLEVKARSGLRTAILSKRIIKNLDSYLAATQLGITLASLGLGWIGEPVVSKALLDAMKLFHIDISAETAHEIALPLAFMIITILHIVFGELAPKSIAIQHSEKTTLWLAYPLRAFYIVFKPFVWLLNGISGFLLRMVGLSAAHSAEVHSSEELQFLVRQGKESGVLQEENYSIIKNAFDFTGLSAKQVMVPRSQVTAIDLKDFDEAALQKVIGDGYSRIPCYETTLDHVKGVVYLKELLIRLRNKDEINTKELVHPVIFVAESQKIGSILKEFQAKRQQLAVVVDEFGDTAGIVTMEDILEELVGEIQDEYDEEYPIVKKQENNSFIVLGTASIHDINKYLPLPIDISGQNETLSGLIVDQSSRMPEVGETSVVGNYEATIIKRNRNIISLVQLREITH